MPSRPQVKQSLVTKMTAQRIEGLCKETHLTLAHVARLSGVADTTVKRLVRGTAEPTEETLERLHKALDAAESTLLVDAPARGTSQEPRCTRV